jgi:hypothetical protein
MFFLGHAAVKAFKKRNIQQKNKTQGLGRTGICFILSLVSLLSFLHLSKKEFVIIHKIRETVE